MDTEKRDHHLVFQPNEYPLNPGLRLLEASAGTGKTFALAHLVLRLLTEAQHSWDKILVVTFTDAAAAELRDRIGTRLEEALAGIEAIIKDQRPKANDPVMTHWLESKVVGKGCDQRWAAILLEALESLEQADITTIHSFCRRTLKRQALESGSAMNPEVEGESQQLVNEVVHDYWQQEILALNPNQVRGLQAAGLNSKSLIKTLLKLDGDPAMNLEKTSNNFDPSKSLPEQFEHWMEMQWQDFLCHWKSDGRNLEEDFCCRAKEWRSQGASSSETKPFSIKPRKNRCDALQQWINSIQIPSPSYGSIRDQKNLIEAYFHPAVWTKVSQRCGVDQPSLSRPSLQKAIANLWDGPAEEVWRHALHRGLNELASRRQKKGVITYAGLLAALDPGRNKGESCPMWINHLRSRYRVALIDEFQDTDPVQWRLLNQAFGQSKDHLLLMVGDPKQAIYRFRGGDLNTYIKARASSDRIDSLLDNYRTTAPLMEALNQLMATGMPRSGLEVPAVNPKSETKPLKQPEGESPLRLITLDNQEDDSKEDNVIIRSKTDLEATIPTAITNIVLELLDESNEVLPEDICLLVNTHQQADDLRKCLSTSGIPTRLVSQGDVLSSDAALVLQHFLDCLAAPANSKRLRLIACSALIQWGTEEIKAAEENGALDALALRFQHWAEQLPNLGLQGCLAQLMGGRMMADISGRSRLLGDLNQCTQLTQEAMHKQGLNASSAADWLRRQRLQPSNDIPSHRQPHSDIAESAVAIITIHRSKGLEYPIVICPYLWEAPTQESGPLWRLDSDQSWCIALNKGWGKGLRLSEQAFIASLQEAERRAYVAMTRACRQLILVWARGSREQGNPLQSWLFGRDSMDVPIEELTSKKMRRWLVKQKIPISIHTSNTTDSEQRWQQQLLNDELALGPTPSRRLDPSWGRSSYSAWISSPSAHATKSAANPAAFDEGRDTDQLVVNPNTFLDNSLLANTKKLDMWNWPDEGELAKFPKGAAAGDCLHRILEQLEFTKPLNTPTHTEIISSELRRSGLDTSLLTSVQKGLQRVLTTKMGNQLGGLQLNQLTDNRRLHELSFDLPVAQKGNALRSEDVANVFRHNPDHRFGSSYADQLNSLCIYSRGFLTGSIDLVFTDSSNTSSPRWWITDWKSNWIGKQGKTGELPTCGPIDYTPDAIEKQMILHHYPLQAHIYLVALHRFLKWRLTNYNPLNHLGGYVYVFLRGLPGEEAMEGRPCQDPVPGLLVEPAPVERVLALDYLLRNGGR